MALRVLYPRRNYFFISETLGQQNSFCLGEVELLTVTFVTHGHGYFYSAFRIITSLAT
jgi:hypothetical protein